MKKEALSSNRMRDRSNNLATKEEVRPSVHCRKVRPVEDEEGATS